MGEAKKRGSREERIDQALHMHKPTSIDEIKCQMGLSDDSLFLGYVVHLPESDEFLVEFYDDDYITKKLWGAIPDFAIRYQDFHHAVKVLKAVSQPGRKTVIALLWEVGDQFIVTFS
jgi:hypothetical protein